MFHLDPLPPGDALRLSGGEGRHAATVRRLRPGETVEVTDGRGELAECTVTRAGRDELDLAVVRRRYVPPPRPRLVVVQALAKGERAELAVELLTEAGVDEVVPWQAERSVVRWDRERAGRALGRWRSTAREAAKQSRRAHWPVIAEPVDTAAAAARLAAADLALVLHPAGEVPLGEVVVPVDGDIVVVVGPEGGLGDGERAAFAAAGALVCRAGPTVLRASTAGAVAAAVLLSRSPRWS